MKLLGPIVIVALGACTTFDPIQRNVCGNGLLEPGEDCDSHDSSCVACAVTCTTVTDCPSAAYTCGVDGECHAPGGALGQPVSAGLFESNEFRITDIDQDRIGDAIGVSRSSIVIRHGDPSGQLATIDSIVTPSQTGPVSFGTLDADGSTDLTITTQDGIVAYTSPYGTLAALNVGSYLISNNTQTPPDLRMMFGINKTVLGGFIVDDDPASPTYEQMYYLVVDFADPTHPKAGLPCGHNINVADFSPNNVDVYQATRDTTDPTAPADLVVALIGGPGPTKPLCVLAIHKDNALNLANVVDITPASNPSLATKPILADLTNDNDHCPGVINSDGGVNALKHWDGQSLGTGLRCGLKPGIVSAPPVGTMLPGAALIGRVTLNPVPFNTAPDMLVVTDGVYSMVGGAFSNVYRSSRNISHAASADLNHDGFSDFVLSGAGQDDLDVLYNYAGSAFFELLKIDTASEVTSLTLDDFDGNGVGDIAYTERIGGHQRLMVAYGTSDRPLAPIEVAEFGDMISIARVAFPDSVDVLNVCTDLVVLIPNGAGPATFTILHGSPQRTMLPYFDPRDDLNQAATVFRGSVIGSFVAPSSGPDYPDVVGIAPPKTAGGTITKVKAWTAAGLETGLDGTPSDGVTLAGLADCGLGDQSGVCVDDAAYLPWSIGPAHDVIFGIDRSTSPQAALFDPQQVANKTVTALAVAGLQSAIPANVTIRSLHAADLDGTGTRSLIAAFGPRTTGSGAGSILVCSVDSAGQPTACVDLVPTIKTFASTTVACLDAAPARIGFADPATTPAAASDLVVLCTDSTGYALHRVYKDSGGYHAMMLAHTTTPLTQIQVGDVTGDGVDDVVALEGQAGAQSLLVFPQCTSRNVATCSRGTAEGDSGGSP